MKARMTADLDKQMLLKENEAIQRAYKELKEENRSLLEDTVHNCTHCMYVV